MIDGETSEKFGDLPHQGHPFVVFLRLRPISQPQHLLSLVTLALALG
jgi:hypothetical protein